MTKDTGNYSNSIEFEVEVYPGVFWIPINTLGKSRYTSVEMASISVMSPEEKKERISNLYEAVQLFQASAFRGTLDNINNWLTEDLLWQTHKAPYCAVLSNEGCCATDTNWLAYFLDGKYDAIHAFCYANEDGNGHITSCIQQDDWFYFLDMMMCRNDSQRFLCKENGVLAELLGGEWAGFLYKCKDPLGFTQFHISRCQDKSRPVPFCFYMRDTAQVFATGLSLASNEITLLIPRNENPRILYCDETSSAKVLIVDLPKALSS